MQIRCAWYLGLFLWLLPFFVGANELPLDKIKLPPGFKISIFALAPGARSMTISPQGTVFVGTRQEGKVYAIVTRNNQQEVITIAQNLDSPNGVAIRNGDLYVSEISRILRYDNIEANLKNPPKPVVVNSNFPSDPHHGAKFIRFGPDGMLYVPVGAPCNICERNPNRYAVLMRMQPNGTQLEPYARGIRNTVGFDWDPRTKHLWLTDNGSDWMGNNIPPDKLNYAPKKDMNFGYPYCHGGDIPDPVLGRKYKCSEFTPPAQKLGPHVAALGMRFYTADMFPEQFKNQIFIAEHGSWNRDVPIGYRVTWVQLKDNRPVSYSVFADGWLQDGRVWGRPVDVEVMKDGSLLVSDDRAGVIYRITYQK